MLPSLYRDRYQEFTQLLQQLQQAAAMTQLDVQELRQGFLEAQKFFQQQILSLDASDLEPTEEPRLRSYQTEISKQLQLLGMDIMFLQAARQQETVADRQMQLSQRLQTLMSYCDAVLLSN